MERKILADEGYGLNLGEIPKEDVFWFVKKWLYWRPQIENRAKEKLSRWLPTRAVSKSRQEERKRVHQGLTLIDVGVDTGLWLSLQNANDISSARSETLPLISIADKAKRTQVTNHDGVALHKMLSQITPWF